ncbi:isochorismatase family protein [Catenuloplanes japonicus]|uniref:isochorismatase family protein n=1 Tax=Catenuloplanes japonicus TaxID=33876 RepID=UPI000525794D|nr:isochorismatase family protein [Catenuloplanes japonicus]
MPQIDRTRLLTTDDHVLILLDHQYMQVVTVTSHDPGQVVDNTLAVAKTAKLAGVPVLLSTGLAARQPLISQLAELFPDQKPIDRVTMSGWEDEAFVRWVADSGRRRIVVAGLSTEVCLQLTVLPALADGYEVFILTDSSGSSTREAHDMAVQRMTAAGAQPLTTWAYTGELVRTYANPLMAAAGGKVMTEHGGLSGIALQWTAAMAKA